MPLWDIFIGSGPKIARTAILGVLAYVSLLLVLRASGKRTLSKLNAFDFVVTIALGSCLATIILSKDTSLLQGATAFAVLTAMQFVVAWLSARYPRVGQMVRAKPTLLAYRGELQHAALKSERVAVDELYAALRNSGLQRMDQADAIVLESDGSLSVLHGEARELTALRGVQTGAVGDALSASTKRDAAAVHGVSG